MPGLPNLPDINPSNNSWALKRTSILVVVGSPKAFESQPVQREVRLFRNTGKRMIPIDFAANRFRLVPYHSLGGMFYLHDNQTGKRVTLETKDKDRATELLVAHNEAAREPAFNLLKARVYMAASDPEVGSRTWSKALDALVDAKRPDSANRRRWEVFAKDKAIKPLLNLVILETRADLLSPNTEALSRVHPVVTGHQSHCEHLCFLKRLDVQNSSFVGSTGRN